MVACFNSADRLFHRLATQGGGISILAEIVELLRPFVQITDLSNDALTQLLLHGDHDLSYELNRNILQLTLRFIHETGRFD